ncbi:MAG: cation-translocating P-type ATPase [Clostridiales bacterium]|nr:cation-translocating P-type ATPase [Clostridiales bacterium]
MKRKNKKEPQISRQPVERIQADKHQGLTSAQAAERAEKGWSNVPVDPPSKSIEEIITSNLFTYFNMIFAGIAVLLIFVGAFRDLTFLPVIIGNTLVGIVQEIRSKKVLDNLNVLNAPKATVVRDGKKQTIPAEEVVMDDVAVFAAGNQICADATVMDGEVQVNESLLTGESDEITKKPGDSLMSGSFIVSGTCHARLDKVGADSYISKLTLEAKATKEGEQSEMIRSLNRLVQIVGFLIIPIGAILFIQQYLLGESSIKESVQGMVAAVIGMIPEGLYLLASVALVVSVMRLAGKKVLVHDMKCIETLARVNVLCVDKTGTITENTMKVSSVVPLAPYESETLPPLPSLIGDFAHAMSKDNITMAAMQEYFTENTGKLASFVTSFSSAFKYSSATFEGTSYVLGAPEFVLREDYETYQETIESYGGEGYRVLVFGVYEGIPDGKALTGKVIPYGLVLLANPIRKEAWETFQYFADQGVDIKVISGDNPVTVSKVASQAGIARAENYIDASELKTKEDIDRAVLEYTVFGRVTPNQKRQFVRSLKEAGKTVAMTGDGVNDVLALKDADCSVAMASGSDAAAQASQLVLLESNFSCMPSVVLEGRRVVNNIERSASLFLVKNMFSFLLALFSMAFMITYPLEPSQVSLIGMFTIGIPAFLLAMEPNKKMIQGHFLTNVLLKALPAGLTDVLIVGFLVIFGAVFGLTSEEISTAATLLLAIVGLMILFNISKPMNKFRWVIWIGMVAGLIFCSIFLKELFAIGKITRKCGMVLIIFAIATEPLLRYISILIRKIEKTYKRKRERQIDKLYRKKNEMIEM